MLTVSPCTDIAKETAETLKQRMAGSFPASGQASQREPPITRHTCRSWWTSSPKAIGKEPPPNRSNVKAYRTSDVQPNSTLDGKKRVHTLPSTSLELISICANEILLIIEYFHLNAHGNIPTRVYPISASPSLTSQGDHEEKPFTHREDGNPGASNSANQTFNAHLLLPRW
ncbi:hypothetical protein BDV96DRAFT_595333 [Lophiotrema nucula]|uniref:Uncharacterized protein n=1 Tax=Lophiotrema nucula TaxID=690887 RepID=A0A6A5ZPX2_9PLEO|nr:hypothetical protein BDV96DRAFT_595333 [Lophiotrema nucula]